MTVRSGHRTTTDGPVGLTPVIEPIGRVIGVPSGVVVKRHAVALKSSRCLTTQAPKGVLVQMKQS